MPKVRRTPSERAFGITKIPLCPLCAQWSISIKKNRNQVSGIREDKRKNTNDKRKKLSVLSELSGQFAKKTAKRKEFDV